MMPNREIRFERKMDAYVESLQKPSWFKRKISTVMIDYGVLRFYARKKVER